MEGEEIIFAAHIYTLMRHPEESKDAFLELIRGKDISEEYALSHLFGKTGISYKHSSNGIIEKHLDDIFPKMQKKPYTVLKVLTHKDAEEVVGSLFKNAYDMRNLSDELVVALRELEFPEPLVVSSYGIIVPNIQEASFIQYIAVRPSEFFQVAEKEEKKDIGTIVGKVLREKGEITERYFSEVERMNTALKEGSFDDFLNSTKANN